MKQEKEEEEKDPMRFCTHQNMIGENGFGLGLFLFSLLHPGLELPEKCLIGKKRTFAHDSISKYYFDFFSLFFLPAKSWQLDLSHYSDPKSSRDCLKVNEVEMQGSSQRQGWKWREGLVWIIWTVRGYVLGWCIPRKVKNSFRNHESNCNE